MLDLGSPAWRVEFFAGLVKLTGMVWSLPVRREHGVMLLQYLQGAEQPCQMDCVFVFDFLEGCK